MCLSACPLYLYYQSSYLNATFTAFEAEINADLQCKRQNEQSFNNTESRVEESVRSSIFLSIYSMKIAPQEKLN